MKNDITQENISFKEKLIKLENENNKEDAMRHMVWYAMSCMILYPVCIILCDIYKLDSALHVLSSLAETYFISVSGIVAVYFGANAYSKKSIRNQIPEG